ncbi:hypothetical protein BDV19DRAFT_389709 [Aspergillus venezuelensis]
MSRRKNPPRLVRRKLNHDAYKTRRTINRISDDELDTRHKSPSRNGHSMTPAPPNRPKKLLLCLDYGTASTSISYTTFDPDDPPTDIIPSDISSIQNWPQARGFTDNENACVPSESWYREGRFLWGFQVQQTLQSLPDTEATNSIDRIVQLPKLLLDEDDNTLNGPLQHPRQALYNVGKTARQAIQDYLMHIFKHAHEQLASREGFDSTWEVELGLCVPSKWSTYAQLTMQEIVLHVMNSTEMQGRYFSMFIIDEPEAAATFALAHITIQKKMKNGSSFIVCDAGGGTVDAITYQIRQESPFRFDEIVTPAGKNCGSSYINQAFIKETRSRLEHITDLGETHSSSKESLIQEYVLRPFECEVKRVYDSAGLETGEMRSLKVPGLQQDPARNLGHGIFYITKEQLDSYFARSLDGTVNLINEQLNEADSKDVEIILLVGGFSKSPALRRRLNEEFRTKRDKKLTLLHLGQDIDMTTAVSRGAVLRTLNKNDGPQRKFRLNLGVCLTERFNPKFKGHTPWFRHDLNGQKYVESCIHWVVMKDQTLRGKKVFEIALHRLFEPGVEMTVCESIYFSDRRVYPHFRWDHPKNSGVRKAGDVEASLEILRERGMLEPKVNAHGQTYYEVHYSIRLEVDGRNMTATIHCPPGEVQGETRICIAAAFRPGTE